MEQAFFELQQSCHDAAWSRSSHKPEYELKKDTISFTHYACSYDDSRYGEHWELGDDMRRIIRGLAHFETGSFELCPQELSRFIGFGSVEDSLWEFTACEKVRQLKMYKNGRVDLKFNSAQYVGEFVSTYLGTVY